MRSHKRLFILLFAGIIAGSFSAPRETLAIKGWKKISNNLGSSLKKAVPKKESKAEPKSKGGIGGFFDKLKKKVRKVVKNIKKEIEKIKDKYASKPKPKPDNKPKPKPDDKPKPAPPSHGGGGIFPAPPPAKPAPKPDDDHGGGEDGGRDSTELVGGGDRDDRDSDEGGVNGDAEDPVNGGETPLPGDTLTRKDEEEIKKAGWNLVGNLDKNNNQGRFGISDVPEFDEGRGVAGENRTQLASARLSPNFGFSAADRAGSPPPDYPNSAPRRETDLVSPNKFIPKVQSFSDEAAAAESQTLAAQAGAKLQLGEYEKAVEIANQSLGSNPNNELSHIVKAEALNHLGRFAEAEIAAWKATRLNPKSADAFRNMGWAQFNLGNLKDALASLTSAIAVNPQDAKSHLARAMVYERMNKRAEMMADLRKAAKLDSAYGAHLRRVEQGGKLFDPNAEDSYKLLDPLDESGPYSKPKAPLADYGLIAAVALSAIGTLVFLWKRFVSPLFLSRKERLARELQSGAPAASAPSPGAADVPAHIDRSGLLAGKYQMNRIIGKGGMGQIWEAKDHSLSRSVAVKQMNFGQAGAEAAREMYIKEAQMLAQVHHPSIVDIFEIIDQPSGLYLVFELLEGKTLEQMIIERKRLSVADAKKILRPVCDGLEFAHKNGIIHRDLKPSNIMYTDKGYVKVMDFGIARKTGDKPAPPASSGRPFLRGPATVPLTVSARTTRTVAGTPLYMAPEAYEGIFSPKVDVYALGIIFYEMVTGVLPFQANSGSDRVFIPASRRVPGITAEFDALIRDSVAYEADSRPASVAEFRRRMEEIAEPGYRI